MSKSLNEYLIKMRIIIISMITDYAGLVTVNDYMKQIKALAEENINEFGSPEITKTQFLDIHAALIDSKGLNKPLILPIEYIELVAAVGNERINTIYLN